MALELSLPALLTRVHADIEVRPAKVKEWLEALPLLNVADTGQRLLTSLSAHNRIAIDPENRLTLLELYRPAVRQITRELRKRYVGLPLPLPDKAKGAADAGRQLHAEMAYGYKHVVMAHYRVTRTPAEPRALALPVQRAIRYLTDVLIGTYTVYSPLPADSWRELHALHRYAEQLGVASTALPDPMNATRPTVSVTNAYKHALLLDFSDPYHLPARLVLHGDNYLDRYADAAQLVAVPQHYDPTCQFLIDIESDRAGVPYVEDQAISPPDRYRLLNTIDLARQIHTHLTLLQHGQLPAADGLPLDFYVDGGGELLRRLILAWGIHPQRAYRRNPRAQTEVDVTVGLSAGHYWLNGGRAFVRSSSFVGPSPNRSASTGAPGAPFGVPAEPEYRREHWRLDDESAGGMALSKRGLVRAPVRVGDLIALRFPDDTEWALASVCWVRSANPSDVQIGTQRIAPSAQPVMIQPEDAPATADFLPALRLPALPALNQPGTLLVPRGLYKPERRFHIDDGYRLYPIRGTHLVELTNAYERFQYDAIED